MRRKAKPDLIGAGLAGKTENRGWFLLSPLRRSVNPCGLYFRTRALAGLMVAGGWCERLVIWLPLMDLAARTLRDAIGGRI